MRLNVLLVAMQLAGLLLLASCGCGDPALRSPHPTRTPRPISKLIAILEDPNSQGDQLADAAAELGRWGSSAAPAVPALRRALQYPYSHDARGAAARTLGAIGPDAAEAIPDLVRALQDDSWSIRSGATYALGAIGERAACAVPALAGRLWDSNVHVRMHAAGAIDVITGVDLVGEVHEPRPGWPAGFRRGWSEVEEEQAMIRARSWWMEEGRYMDWPDEPCLHNPTSP